MLTRPSPETAFTALGYAIRNGELRTVREILEGDEFSHQLLKRADYAGNTALHLAAIGPNPEILRELLERGASVHARNHANNTPLYLAEKTGNAECVRLLKEAGAHLWMDNNLKKEGASSRGVSRGQSPDHLSSRSERTESEGEGETLFGDEGEGSSVGEAGMKVEISEQEVEQGSQAEPARPILMADTGKIIG